MQLGVKDAARLLEVSEKTIRLWIEEGSLPAYQVDGQSYFNRAELLEWATTRRKRVSPDIYKDADAAASEELPPLSLALVEGGVHGGVAAKGKNEALRALVGLMRLPEDADRAFLLDMLLAREALGSTGVGEGIAIPHARNPIVLRVTRPLVTLCYLEPPVDFSALDGRPVHALFGIVTTTIRGHLHLLSRLAFALREPAVQALLRERAPQDKLLAELRRIEETLGRGGAAR